MATGRPHRARGQLRLPIRIDGSGFSAVELTLPADPSLNLRSVELSPRGGAAVRFRATDGTIAVALVSPRPLDRLRLVAIFDGTGGASPTASRVDELP